MKSTIEAMKFAIEILKPTYAAAGERNSAIEQLLDAIKREEAQSVEPLTSSYVQPVPDSCDRITWRNQYYHLPTFAELPAPAKQPLISERKELVKKLHLVADRIEHGDAGIDSITSVRGAANMLANDTQTIAELENRVEACEYATNSTGLRKQIEVLKVDKQGLETELACVKAKWQDDYLTLNDVCNQQIELEAAAKLALDALQSVWVFCNDLTAEDFPDTVAILVVDAIEALKKAGIK
jgi:hypothetical protein